MTSHMTVIIHFVSVIFHVWIVYWNLDMYLLLMMYFDLVFKLLVLLKHLLKWIDSLIGNEWVLYNLCGRVQYCIYILCYTYIHIINKENSTVLKRLNKKLHWIYMYMYVYNCICMHACMYVCMYICMYVCMYLCI